MDTTTAIFDCSRPIATRGRRGRALAAAALVAIGATGVAAADAAAAVTLKKSKAFAVRAPAAATPDRVYDADGAEMSVVCDPRRAGSAPLLVGWSGLRSPVGTVDWSWAGGFGLLRIRPRYALTATTQRPYALCAKGLPRPRVVTGRGDTVSCGRSLALGVPFSSTWPYTEQAVYAKPDGPRRWKARTGDRSSARALCVAARAFKQVANVRAAARFKVGRVETSVTATCKGGRRPIAWGHEADPMPSNTWQSVETLSIRLSVPFVSAAQPAGARGWKLTFRTADQLPAQQATKIAVHVTCAVPA